MKEQYAKIRGRIEIEEMRVYRKILTSPDGHETGKARFSAPSGAHDDACMATLGGIAVCGESPGGLPRMQDTPDPVSVFDRYINRKPSKMAKRLNSLLGLGERR